MRNKVREFLRDYPLEIRILIIAAIGGMGFAVFTGLACLFLDLGPLLIGSSIGTGVVGLITLYYAIIKKSYRIPAYFGVLALMVVFYPFMWVVNGGSHGPMFFYMIFNAVFCSILLAYLNYKVMFVIQLTVVYGLLALERLQPSLIVPYKDSFTRTIDIGFSFTIVFLVTFYMVTRIMHEYRSNIVELENVKQALLDTNERLLTVSETDELTGISNRRRIMNTLKQLIYSKESKKLSLVMMDIDHFKKINDTYGHSVGDEVIKMVSLILSENIEETDTIGRIGGEEFLIVMPGVGEAVAYEKAECLREKVESLVWDHVDMKVTISGGVYCERGDDSLDDLLENVDKRLYAAKNNGRNRIS